VVDNRPGAAAISIRDRRGAAPDGYTISRHHQFACDNVSLYSKLGTTRSSRSRHHADRIESQRARGARVGPFKSRPTSSRRRRRSPQHRFASARQRYLQHLSAELAQSLAKIDLVHVRTKEARRHPRMSSGQVPMISTRRSCRPAYPERKVARAGVTSASGRRHFPRPTVAEAVCPVRTRFLAGALRAGRHAAADLDRLYAEIARILSPPRCKERLASLGMNLPDDTGRTVDVPESGIEKWARVIKARCEDRLRNACHPPSARDD